MSVVVQGRDKHAGCLACSEPALLGSGFDQNVFAFVCMEVNSLVLSTQQSELSKIGTFRLTCFRLRVLSPSIVYTLERVITLVQLSLPKPEYPSISGLRLVKVPRNICSLGR